MKVYRIAKLSESDINTLMENGFNVKDYQSFGEYELYLMEAQGQFVNMLAQQGIPVYQIGFQRLDTSCVDLDCQMQSNPPESEDIPIKEGLEWISNTIRGWIGQYGALMAQSHSSNKNRVYMKMLARMGFSIEQLPLMGQEITIIT